MMKKLIKFFKNSIGLVSLKNKKINHRPKEYLIFLDQLHASFQTDYGYCEIGVQRFLSWRLSRADVNIGIDPEFARRKYVMPTKGIEIFFENFSNSVFRQNAQLLKNLFSLKKRWLFFIDGEHTAKGVLSDLINISKVATAEGLEGTVLAHDVLPLTEEETDRSCNLYVGDGYKVVSILASLGIDFQILNLSPSGILVLDQNALYALSKQSETDLESMLDSFADLTVEAYWSLYSERLPSRGDWVSANVAVSQASKIV